MKWRGDDDAAVDKRKDEAEEEGCPQHRMN